MDRSATTSPFHRGEQEVQTRLGVRDIVEGVGQRFIRDHLPEQHSEFFSQLPFVLIGAVDTAECPWATILMGRPGFISSPDPKTLNINTRMVYGDPLANILSKGAHVGLLGIEYHSRRRNRATGKVTAYSDHLISIKIDQAFGNCPQYIQSRNYELLPEIEAIGEPLAITNIKSLDGRAQDIISRADHFYIATHYSDIADDDRHPVDNSKSDSRGADVSHRGGRPGFVCIEGERTLTFPDFSGNNHFNTIGNISLNPRAGLLFIDYEHGDLLYLTCEAEIIWDSEVKRAFVGAERLLRFTINKGLLIENAVPIRWQFREYSPSLEWTGSWDEVSDKLRAIKKGNQYSNYRVVRVQRESETITSFYLEPEESSAIPCHVAGQFLPIEIQPPNSDTPVQRTYTISCAPNGSYYRLSIKREPAARRELSPGLSSNYFHDHVSCGMMIRALSPRGKFKLDELSTRPVVLISGGVGITPMISMLEQLVNDSEGCGRTRPVWFIHGAVNSEVHAFGSYINILDEEHSFLNSHIRYSDPTAKDVMGEQFDSTGHVDADLLKSLLPLDDYDFYLCGPPPFMESLYNGLKSLNIDDERINYEFFGPGATLHKESGIGSLVDKLGDQQPVAVEFKHSGIQVTWDPSKGTLLDLAESEGLQPAYSCRSGICQTCATKISQGTVAYIEPPMVDPEAGSALICSCYPQPGTTEDGESLPLILDL